MTLPAAHYRFTLSGCILQVCILTACSKQAPTPQTAITGTLSLDQPVQLAADARLELRLTDVTGVDGAAVELTSIATRLDGLPYQYTLPFDASRIDNTHRYTVDARVFANGKLRYTTDTAYPVLTQGQNRQRDITLVTAGENEAGSASPLSGGAVSDSVFRGELRTDTETSIWSAGLQHGALAWIEEDRGSGKGVMHARYQFKGAYVLYYADSSPLEIRFDERGRPVEVLLNQKAIKVEDAMTQINAVRNRASLLRSEALAVHEAKQHRDETDQTAAHPGAMKLTP